MFGHWHDLPPSLVKVVNIPIWDYDFEIAVGVLAVLFIGFIYHWRQLNQVTTEEDDLEAKRKKIAEKH